MWCKTADCDSQAPASAERDVAKDDRQETRPIGLFGATKMNEKTFIRNT